MRFGIKALYLEFELSRQYWRAKIPLRFKLTFYIGTVSLVCMIVLAAVCIVQALSNTQVLMQKRLSQFASINSQQIEMIVNNQAAKLNNALQSDSVTSSFESLYNGTVTSEEWASNLDELAKYLFSTSLQSFQALYLYDTSATLLFSLANPELTTTKLHQLKPALSAVLPLGAPANGSYQLPSNYSAATAQAAQAAVNASHAAFNSTNNNSSSSLNYTGSAQVRLTEKDADSHKKSHLKINFTTTPDGFLSFLSRPIPLANPAGVIDSYSYSFSVPITELTVIDSVQTSRLVGYCTAISDCSRNLYLNDNPAYNDTLLIREMKNPTFAVVDADAEQGWKYLFPVGRLSSFDNSTWHPFESFPAVAADIELSSRIKNSTRMHKPGGALMTTRSPKIGRASIGFSFANVLNQRWYITLSLPKSQVEYGYHYLTKILIAVAAVLLVFVVFAAFVLTGLTTNPVIHIYRGMVLKPRQRNDGAGKKGLRALMALKTENLTRSGTASINLSSSRSANSDNTITEDYEMALPNEGPYEMPKVLVDSEWAENHESLHSVDSLSTIYFDEDEDEAPFQVPQPLEPLGRRWIFDEFDELIHEYNVMIYKLNAQCAEMEDKVRSRTREARENQRLAETANAAKSLFMMNISHELLTPMNGIMGITAVTIEETNMDAIRASLKTIINSGNILQELLQELLNYAAHLAGVEEHCKTFSMEEMATDMRATFANRAKTTGIGLEIQVHENLPTEPGPHQFKASNCLIESDYEKVKHICTSLISNALKFTHPEKKPTSGPSVAVHVSIRNPDRMIKRSIECHPHTAMLDIMVQDNGVGISKEILVHVFDVFVQGDDALSKRFTGTGLGLALSKLLCERLGGYIAVYTRLNIGTTVVCRIPVRNVNGFTIHPSTGPSPASTPAFTQRFGGRTVWRTDTFHCGQLGSESLARRSLSASRHRLTSYEPILNALTLEASQSKTEEATSSQETIAKLPSTQCVVEAPVELDLIEARKIRVLVADDNQVMRELIRRILVLLGIGRIDLASNGHSAIEKVEDAIIEGVRYSIIFMDLTMPKTGGIEATTNIRKQLGYFCPVVALTGHSDDETMERCKQAGLQKVLVKPVTRTQLAQVISELVGIPIVSDNSPKSPTSTVTSETADNMV